MTRKLLPLFAVFIAVSAILFWVKWKRENPTPTSRDLAARRRLIADNNAYIRAFVASGQTKISYLSRQEREEIASHLWIVPTTPPIMNYSGNLELYWKSEKVVLSSSWLDDSYQTERSGPREDNYVWYKLHPATSLYLRRWLANHPDITNDSPPQ